MLRQLFTTYNLVFNKRSSTDWVIEEYQISLPDSKELEWELILLFVTTLILNLRLKP